MLETIEKLLVLQDRDRKIHRVQQELAQIAPEREHLRTKATATQAQLEAAKTRVKQIESDRKRLELDVEAKKAADREIRQPAVADAQERGIPRARPRN